MSDAVAIESTCAASGIWRGDRWSVLHDKWQPVLPRLESKCIDVAILDPPYSEHVHTRSRQGASLPDTAEFKCRFNRAKEISFPHISTEEMAALGVEMHRLVKRWVLIFCDIESVHLWRSAMEAAGLEYVRTGLWVKLGGTPQFTGDRPSVGAEAIVICHRKGKKRWNGRGTAGVWSHPVEANRLGNRGARVHETQKPVTLLTELVSLFSDPNELVLDCYAGSGTTAAACLRTGRQVMLVEQNAKWAETCAKRCLAEAAGSTLADANRGQLPLLGGVA